MKSIKIGIGILDTGGGHRSIATALKEAFLEVYDGNCEVVITNVLNFESPGPNAVEKIYNWLQKKQNLSFLYTFIWYACNNTFLTWFFSYIFGYKTMRKGVRLMREMHPDILILAHSHIMFPVSYVLNKTKLSLYKTVFVCDPFSVHHSYLANRSYDTYFICSEIAEKQFLRHKYKKNKLEIVPFPVRKNFQEPYKAEEILKLKQKHNFPLDKKIIFFAGSGEGFTSIEEYVNWILKGYKEKPEIFNQYWFVVVLGKNKKQFFNIQKMVGDNEHFRVYGFSNIMKEIMGCSDIVVGKAGPSLMFETLILQKVFFISFVLYGQEKGNKDFILNHNLGYLVDKPKKLYKRLIELSHDLSKLEEMYKNVARLKMKNGSKITALKIKEIYEKYEKNLILEGKGK